MSTLYQNIIHSLGYLLKNGLSYKLIVLGLLQFLPISKVQAQDPPTESFSELISMMKISKPDTNRICLQLKLGCYYFFKPNGSDSDRDSVIYYFNQATQLSDVLHEIDWKYRTLELTGCYFLATGDLHRCTQCFMSAIAYYHQTGNIKKEARGWTWLADIIDGQMEIGHREDKIGYLQHAAALDLQCHQEGEAKRMVTAIADREIANNEADRAEKGMLQVLPQFKALGYYKIDEIYLLLFEIEFAKGNYYRAMSYCTEALGNMKRGGDSGRAWQFYYNMASCNNAIKNKKEALAWIRKAVLVEKRSFGIRYFYIQILLSIDSTEEARIALNEFSKMGTTRSLSDSQFECKSRALYYDKTNKDDLAIRYNNTYLELTSRLRGSGGSQQYYNACYLSGNFAIADSYLKINQPAKAKKHIDNIGTVLKNASSPLEPGLWVSYYDKLYRYDIAIGNYRDAAANLKRHNEIQDSVFTADKEKQIAELNIQYETAQKEQSIKDLHNLGDLQQARLEKASLQRNITIGGVVLLLIIAGIAYNGYLHKQRSNLQLLAKQQQINAQNTTLQHLLTEKEWLLKEVHHRVKNNLHTVICLLEAQGRRLEKDALKAIENSQHRIYAMSLIHQKLYLSDDIRTIDMAEYIPELIRSLAEGFGTSDQIRFNVKIDAISLTLSHAIPLGLIINEAVTNSIKYAFPNGREGEITMSMIAHGEVIQLEMADNGIGMLPIDLETEPESMGLRLMKGLSADIGADIRFDVGDGTRITILFKPDELNEVDNHLISSQSKETYA